MHIGTATAIGQPLELPIFVRSLAESLAMINYHRLPLDFDESLLAALDNGVDPDSPAALVADYHCDWWNYNKQSGPDELLNADNLQAALRHHWAQHPYTAEPPVPTIPIPNSPVATPACARCQEYRDIASQAVAELEGLFRFAEAAETSARSGWETDMRRAQGLYMLHQAVLHKETSASESTARAASASVPPPAVAPSKIDGVKVNPKSRRMFNEATAELERLQQLPLGSYKWTWGAELSAAEVREVNPPPGPRQRPHSGYRASLPDGRYREYFSPDPVPPSTTTPVCSALASDIMDLPPMPDGHQSVDKIAMAHNELPTRRQNITDPPTPDIADPRSTPATRYVANECTEDQADNSLIPNTIIYQPDIMILGHFPDSHTAGIDGPSSVATRINEGSHDHAMGNNAGVTDPDTEPNVEHAGVPDASPIDVNLHDPGIDADDEDTDTEPDVPHTRFTDADRAAMAWGADSDAQSDVNDSHAIHPVAADVQYMHLADADQAGVAWGDESSDTHSDVDSSEAVGQRADADVHPKNVADADMAGQAWGDASDAESEVEPSEPAATVDDLDAGVDDNYVADADLAARVWGEESDAEPADSDADSDSVSSGMSPTANDAAYAWNTGSHSPTPPRSATADPGLSTSDADPHLLEFPSVTPSRITLPRVYSEVDFGFVDSSWLPTLPAGDGESSMDDDDNFFN